MNEKGWIRIDRKIQDNWIYSEKPFSKFHAWIDLILLAEHKTHKKIWRGNLTEFKRGDVCTSISELSKRWGWSRDKTRRFLNDLETDNMVRVNATTHRTTISLVNYGKYQNQPTTNKATNNTTDKTTDKSTDNTTDKAYLNKYNNINNINKYKQAAPLNSSSESEDVEMWNGKPVDDLSDDEWIKYMDSWEE